MTRAHQCRAPCHHTHVHQFIDDLSNNATVPNLPLSMLMTPSHCTEQRMHWNDEEKNCSPVHRRVHWVNGIARAEVHPPSSLTETSHCPLLLPVHSPHHQEHEGHP